MQFAIHDEDATPNNVARFGNAFDGAAAETEIHRRLAFTGSSFVTADEMRGRSGAGNQKHPNIIIHTIAAIMLAPAQIVQGVFGRETELPPKFVREKPVEPG